MNVPLAAALMRAALGPVLVELPAVAGAWLVVPEGVDVVPDDIVNLGCISVAEEQSAI